MSTADALVARLRADPRDRAAYEALRRLHRDTGDRAALARLTADWAAECEDPREASAAYVEVAALVLQEFGDAKAAEDFYLEALRRWPRNAEAALAVQRSWELAEDYARVADFLREHAEALEAHGAPPEEVASVCLRLGDVWKRFGELDEALRNYRRAAELDQGQAHAAYEAATLLATRMDELDAGATSAEYSRVADLLCQAATGLEPAQQVERLERALGYAPWHDRALTGLERLLAGTEREAELAPHWVNYLLAAPDDPTARERRVRLAHAYLAQGQLEDALFALEPAAELGYAPALHLIEELRGGSGPHPAPQAPRSRPAGRIAIDGSDAGAAADGKGVLSERASKPVREEPAPLADMDEEWAEAWSPEPEPEPEPGAGDATPVPPAPHGTPAVHSEQDGAERVAQQPSPGSAPPPTGTATAVAAESSSANVTEDETTNGPEAEVRKLKRQAIELVRKRKDDEAAALYRRALDVDPLDREAFDALDAHYRRKQDHHARAALLMYSAEATGLPRDVKRARLKDAATVYESRLRDADTAVQIWRTLAELDPDGEEPARAIKRLLEQSQRWDDLVGSIEREIANVPTAPAKVALLRRLAGVHRERRGDLASAVAALQEVARLVPNDRMVRDALVDDLMTLERFADVAPLLRRQVDDTATRAQKLPLLRKLAALYLERLDDPENAFATYERILELNPNDDDALDAMEVIDRAGDSHARLIGTLARRAASASKERAAELHLEMASIAEHEMHDHERAAELLLHALDLAPQDGRILDALCTLHTSGPRYEDLVETLRERIVIERDRAARAELYRRLARTLRDHLEDAAGAVEAWQKVLDLGEDAEALAELRAHAERHGDAALSVEILQRLIQVERDPEARRALLFDRAKLLSDRLAKPVEAIQDLVRLLRDVDPTFEPALAELRGMCDRIGDHRALADVIERRVESASSPELRAAHARELADLYEGKAADPERAIRALQRWVDSAPADAAPLRRLVPLVESKRRYPQLLAALDALATLETTPAARASASVRAAQVASGRLRDQEGAWQRLAVLMETGAAEAEEPLVALARSLGRLDALYDLLERGGRAERLLLLLKERVETERVPKARAPFLRRIAQVRVEFLQDEPGAKDAYRALLEIEEDAEALRFLQAAALREDDAATLCEILKRLAAIERDPIERRDLRLEQARLLRTRLGRAREAIGVLDRLVAEDPLFQPAVDELLAACDDAGDKTKLASVLERLVNQASDAAMRTGYAARLADVYAALGDTKRGITALQRWVDLDPSNPEPYRKLHPLLQTANRHAELVACWDALATLEPAAHARIAATIAAARIAAEGLGDRDGAWGRLAPLVAEADPTADAALAELATLFGRLDELYGLMEGAERYGALVSLLQTRAQREPNKQQRADAFRRIARLATRRLDDDERATAAWRSLLLIGEDAEALRYLYERARRRDDPETQADCLARLAALEKDPGERRDLLFEYGHVLRMRLDRPAEAVRVLREIVDRVDPDFEPALDELVSAAESARDFATLAQTLERLVPRLTAEDARLDALQRLADLYEGEVPSDARAIAALDAWITLRPDDIEPRRRLLAHLERSQDVAPLLVQLDAIALLERDEHAQVAARLRAAELSLDRLRDARGAWDRVATLPLDGGPRVREVMHRIAFEGELLDPLCERYAKDGRNDELTRILRERAGMTDAPGTRSELLRRAARVLRDTLGDEAGATEVWQDLLAIREDAEALAALRLVAERADDPARLAELTGRLANLEADPTRAAALRFEQATLLTTRLGRSAEAIEVLRALVTDLDPSHVGAARALVAAAEQAGDVANLALGLERWLAVTTDPAERAALAERLADVCEVHLKDAQRAAPALAAWCEADPKALDARRRLRPHQERGTPTAALLQTLDALAVLETDPAARADAALAAARCALDVTHDPEGAWTRALPLALAGHTAAEATVREFAERAGLWRPLANLYVLRAQRAKQPRDGALDWLAAARVMEEHLQSAGEAFEAALRALAVDLSNRDVLTEVDRLAVATANWKRLGQIYGRVIDRAANADGKVELLLRHVDLLERHANAPAAALEQLMQACRLAPQRVDLLDRAESIATSLQSHADLTWILERRAEHATSSADRVRELLRAARSADSGMGDREQANGCLRRAIELAGDDGTLADEVFAAAADLDRHRPELGAEDARRALVRAQLELAEATQPPLGPVLVRRAADMLATKLRDAAGAFDAMKQGVGAFLDDDDLFSALEARAAAIDRLDALDAQLARWIDRASGTATSKRLLRRRGHLLADRLDRHAKASEVFHALLALDPDDADAERALITALERAGRYPDLVRAYMHAIERATSTEARVALWRKVGGLWERELKHRPNALEAWRQVVALAPDDEEAAQAVARLDAGRESAPSTPTADTTPSSRRGGDADRT